VKKDGKESKICLNPLTNPVQTIFSAAVGNPCVGRLVSSPTTMSLKYWYCFSQQLLPCLVCESVTLCRHSYAIAKLPRRRLVFNQQRLTGFDILYS